MMTPIESARRDFKEKPASIIAWILMASYLYYHRYDSIFEDVDFDKMMSYTLKHYDNLEHKYKSLVTKDDLQAGSLFALPVDKYPMGIVRLAEHYSREYELYKNTKGGTI